MLTNNMIKTNIKLLDGSTQWGCVTVANTDYTLNREFKITTKEAEEVRDGKKMKPDLVTEDEWLSGRVSVSTKVLNKHTAVTFDGKELMINYGLSQNKGEKFDIKIVKIPEGQWKEENGFICLEEKTVADFNLLIFNLNKK